ncbi:MAG: efflux RND transporter periplasmic adaptor subunit [Defluviitaleaceae bacterium]|nr:efflux RND transporter periplasmic adaptor subunit [Defluviitaleaceae bacterium]
MKKRKKIWLALAVVFLFSACARAETDGPPELITPRSEIDDTAFVTRGTIAQVEQFRGIIRVVSVPLYFLDTGLSFLEFTVTNGQSVKQGDLLARLDTKPWETNIENLQSSIDSKMSDYEAENKKAEIDITIAQLELSRMMRQLAEQGATGEYSDNLMMQIEYKKLELIRMNNNLTDRLEQQSMSMVSERESLANLLARLPLTELYAPFDGVITYMMAYEPGQYVPGYQNVIFISNMEDKFLEYLNNKDRLAISFEKTVTGIMDGEPVMLIRRPLTRQETAIVNEALGPNNNWPGPVRFNIEGNKHPLNEGDFVYIYALTNQRDDVLRIPSNALYFDLELGDYVYKQVGGRKVFQSVEIGIRTTAFVEILSGLEEGDEIFVKT